MHINFELKKIDENFFEYFDYYLNIGEKSVQKNNIKIRNTLNQFKNNNGSLNGDKMQSNWFPQINADVFLSHSHADKDLVIALAGWLKKNFDLETFIDSCIWGYSKKLQNIIDDKFSRGSDGKLNYDKVLYSSSHVHMMLNTALMQMIDNSECIIFINTPNSVKPGDVVNKIISPWIYSEIGMTKLVKRKNLRNHRDKYLFEHSRVFSDLEIQYNLDTSHLIKLNIRELHQWKKSFFEDLDFSDFPLDYLYKLKK